MSTTPEFATAETVTFETLIAGLIDREVGTCADFLDATTWAGLRANLLAYHAAGAMHPAGVGKHFDYVKNSEIRGDVIKWLDAASAEPSERTFLDRVQRFIQHLNATCYTGIDDCEFHYAYYAEGSFYKRHLDRFKTDKGRQFSFVLYLNEDWQPEHNGRLSLYLEGEELTIYPHAGHVVFFRSDRTEHEVHPAVDRPRLSIAGWLKR